MYKGTLLGATALRNHVQDPGYAVNMCFEPIVAHKKQLDDRQVFWSNEARRREVLCSRQQVTRSPEVVGE